MSHIKQFAAYAAAFEQAYENDDWSEVESFFADDAVYEIGLPILGGDRCEGRAEIVAWFKSVLDRFDRRFATRTLTLVDGPKEEGNEVWIEGTASYTAEGVPDLVLKLAETIRFDGNEIVHLEDRYTPEMLEELTRYAREHGARLGIGVEI
ncbi:MAG: nuclear transport factor 2 family protein [Myxococcota bacterium]